MFTLKKILFCLGYMLVFSLTVFFASCSHGSLDTDFEMYTLRKESDDLNSSIKWEHEIESSILLQKISGADGLVKSLAGSPQYVFASGAEDDYDPIYPQIVGFATLDMRNCPEEAKNVLDGFCTAIASSRNAESFMAQGCMYSLVLFKYDLGSLGYSTFNSYILGEPFVSPEILQCPVRFLKGEDFTLDVLIYLKEDSPGFYKIHNIALKGEV